MSWNGSGVFNRIYSWVADKNAGIDITASRMDADTDDITSNGFGNTLTRDGQGAASANLPMNNFRHTGVGNAQARTDYAALNQVQDGIAINWTTSAGTADALTASYTPALTALVDGQLCFVRASATNATATPTFSPNGLTAHTITKNGGSALVPGDIPGALAEIILRYDLASTRWELLNPSPAVASTAAASVARWAVAGGTADAITATFTPPIASLVDGQLCFIRASAANATATPTFAPDGLTAHTITKQGGAALVAGNISAALAEYILRYNLASTRWELLNPTVSSSVPPQGSFKSLSIKVVTNTTVAVAADQVVTTDGTSYQTTALSGTINLGTNGAANALDTGTIAIDTWYAIWAIAKADGTTAGLASLSATAPTLPAGYTFKARYGWVRTIHASATLYGTWQFGRRAGYKVGLAQTTVLPAIATGPAGTYSSSAPVFATPSVASLVPSTASEITVVAANAYNTGTTANVIVAPTNSYSGITSLQPPVINLLSATGQVSSASFILEATTIAWAADQNGGILLCKEWVDNI